MPTAPLTRCRRCLKPSRSAVCANCTAARIANLPSKPPSSSAQRGYGAKWRKISKRVIAAHPWCVRCGATDDLTVDHVIPKRHGGTDDDSNLQVLCRGCNGRKAAR